jgi:hypothetical protein
MPIHYLLDPPPATRADPGLGQSQAPARDGHRLKRLRQQWAQRRQGIVVFHHIPKTAGTSFKAVLHNNLETESVLELYALDSRDRLASIPNERLASLRAIVGHLPFCFFVPRNPQPPLLHCTLLRRPVDRVLSYYGYIRWNTGHYLHERISRENLSLHDFVLRRDNVELDNLQVRYLCSTDCSNVPIGGCTTEMLEEAKENLAQLFGLVGLQEEFPLTLSLANRKLGWSNLPIPHINRTPDRPALGDVDARTLSTIEALNSLDLELYAFARNLFFEQVRKC